MMEWEEDFYSDEPKSRMTGFIPDKLYEVIERDPLPERTKIISELADRILELKEMSPRTPTVLLHALGRVSGASPSALWLVLEILAGGRDLEKSLSDRGREMSFSKQAIHQRRARDLAKLEEILPGVADSLKAILGTGGKQ